MSPSLLVVGATGTVGREIVRYLSMSGQPVRAMVRTPQNAALVAGPHVETVPGDFADPASLEAAFAGIERAYVVVATLGDHGLFHGRLIDAARRHGVRQLVQLSMLGAAGDSPIGFARAHWELDQQLRDSGLPATILYPNIFMQNLLRQAGSIRDQGMFFAPLADTTVSLIDTRDIAAVAAHLLLTGDAVGENLVLTGGAAVTHAEVAQAFSRTLGRTVAYISPDPDAFRANLLAAGTPRPAADDLLALYAYLRSGAGSAVTATVSDLLRKAPLTIDEFVADHRALFEAPVSAVA